MHNAPEPVPKQKVKLLTLDDSSKININISYNLTEPKNRLRLFTQNERERSSAGSSSYQQTVYTENVCTGKKVGEVFLEKACGASRSDGPAAYSQQFSQPSRPLSHKLAEEVSNECEISIRMVNKRKKNNILLSKQRLTQPRRRTKPPSRGTPPRRTGRTI